MGGAVADYGTAVRAVGWGFFALVVLLLVHTSMYLLPGVLADTGAFTVHDVVHALVQ